MQPQLCPQALLPHLDPEWVHLWNDHGSLTPRADGKTVHEIRASSKYAFTHATYPGPSVHAVKDHTIQVTQPPGEITVRVYTPAGPGPFPAHVNFHGGGWALGSLESEAAWCRHASNEARIAVVDVAYRLAPEFAFPVPIYDCWAAVKWTLANTALLNIRADSVSIGGLSAGCHLAAVVAHFARDEGIDLELQLLVVPVADMRYCAAEVGPGGKVDGTNCAYESVVLFQDLPWGPLARERWYLDCFIGTDAVVRAQRFADWRMTPVLAANFSGLCAAHVVTAEFDVSRDEGEYYAELLRRGGGMVSSKRYEGVPHAFAVFNHPERGLSKAREYIVDTVEVLKRAHGLV